MKEFEKYYMWVYSEDGRLLGINDNTFEIADEAFLLFKDLYDYQYGNIEEADNLISIHSGGWSENEILIEELMKTAWWYKYSKIIANGGHYYFDTDFYNGKNEWIITNQKKLK